MKLTRFIFILAVMLVMFPFNLFAEKSYDDLWKKVEDAQDEGLPETAIKAIEPIYQKALKEKEIAQACRALAEKIVLEGEIQGNKPEEKIQRLEEEINKTTPEMKPVLRIILAKWYYHYFSRNRYRFIDRDTTVNLDSKDFTTWDLPKLFNHIGSIYENVLKDEETLSQVPISKLDNFLEEGNVPTSLRSNLFEFFAHEALEFYMDDEQTTAKPKNAFEIEVDSPAFASVEEFVKWEPQTIDKDSCNLKALKLFQRLLSINIATNNESALIDNDYKRLLWVKGIAVGENKQEAYEKALQSLIANHPDNEFTSLPMSGLARIQVQKGNNIEALATAQKVVEKWPNSFGAPEARNVISDITTPSLSFNTEKVLSSSNSEIKISFKNLDKAYFRLIKRSETDFLSTEYYDPDSITRKQFEKLLTLEPFKSWEESLDPGKEYKLQNKVVAFPKVEKGYYYLLASANKDFTEKENALFVSSLIVSDLSMVVKTDDENRGKANIFILNADSGKPISDAEIKVYYRDHGSQWKQIDKFKTNKEGQYQYNSPEKNVLLIANYKNDKVYKYIGLYRKGFYDEEETTSILFFTDRAIYRPGQTIYFKAIAFNYLKGENHYTVKTDYPLTISLRDPNYQEVNVLKLRTNEFGSVSGTFTAPTDRLTGSYSLNAKSVGSAAYIKVEEYKRPKFKVTIDDPTTAYQLGKTVQLKGRAMAYTGAAIDNAEVSFNVKRNVRFPYWMWWINSRSSAQEITHGKVKTDEKGEFVITFDAKPDRSISKDNLPVFTFTVSADVTDSTGETRSGSQVVRLGYTACEINTPIGEKIKAGEEIPLQINTTTLDGKSIAASGKAVLYSLIQPEKVARQPYYQSNREIKNIIHDWKEGNKVIEENFTTNKDGNFSKNIKLSEGAYRLVVTCKDRYDNDVKLTHEFIALDYESNKMTLKVPYLFEIVTPSLKPGDTFKAFWATGYNEGPAYIELIHRHKILKAYWTNAGKNKEFITLPVTEDMRGGFYIRIMQIKENKLFTTNRNIAVPWSNKDLNLKLVHFNSKMEPSSKESWKLEITGEEAEAKAIEMVAAMYDASLDAYANLYWPGINCFYYDYTSANFGFTNESLNLRNWINDFSKGHSYGRMLYPAFPSEIIEDFYGYGRRAKMCYDMCESAAAPMMLKSEVLMERSPMVGAAPMPAVNSVRASVQSVDSMEEANGANNAVKEDKVEEIDLSKVTARTNLNETAFFYPHLTLDDKGVVTIDFEMPEALTTWKFMGFAHSKNLASGRISQEVITQKELMVQPNAPRFLREGDKIAFTVKVTNLSDKEQSGAVALELSDPITDESKNEAYKIATPKQSFTIPAGQSKGFSWLMDVPYKPGFIKYKAVGATTTNSDGEDGILPVLSSRILVTESLPLPIRGPETKKFSFEKLLASGNSKTLENKGVTVEVTSNPAWYAVQALPFLMEFPHECSEQTFNRIYANTLASYIANSDPKIKKVFEIWEKDEQYNKGTALLSNLEKNQHLKAVTLMETPWVLDAKSETEQKHKIGMLFKGNRIDNELKAGTEKLSKMQNGNGSFPWFPGGPDNAYITLYIMTGYGRLHHIGTDVKTDIALRAVNYLDNWIREYYEEIIKDADYKKHTHINYTTAMYLYGRSFFLKLRPIPTASKKAVDFFIDEAKAKWLEVNSRMSQAHIALALQRFGDTTTPEKIVKSIKEHSVTDDELGRFWRENEFSCSWYHADIETQAMMIEMFTEIGNDEAAVEECKVWLLKQKQTQNWKTTTATADAIYSLILKGADLLASDKLVTVKLAGNEVKPEKVEAGTGYYQKIYAGSEVKPEMGSIELNKEDKGVAWGALHWQYIEDMSKVTPHENNLKLNKSLFVKENTDNGPVIKPVADGKLKVGDLVVVRIELRTDRDLEYVHMKDQRGSGMEPVNVLSRYKWQDGLGYYEATKDSASHFYIDYLPKGTYVFEYELRVQLAGQYQTGMAEIQCMYAPEFNSHSGSEQLTVE